MIQRRRVVIVDILFRRGSIYASRQAHLLAPLQVSISSHEQTYHGEIYLLV